MARRIARYRDLRPYKDTKDTVVHPAAAGDEVARRFGQHTRDAMAAIGVRFGE